MNYNDLAIITILITITLSGIYINFVRNKNVTVEKTTENDVSLFAFRFFIPLSIVLGLIFYYKEIGKIKIPLIIMVLSCFLIIFGLLLRWFAVKQLGGRFNVQISLVENQKLETKGVYKLIRHPSYIGALLYYFGLGVVMQNYISILILIIIPVIVVLFRIKVEERFMYKNLGKTYEEYQKTTKKLIPYIY